MEPVRPLRDVFAGLSSAADQHQVGVADDPSAVLARHGHPGLPDTLLTEAIVSYADSAPVEVAEHLAPFVVAHSPVPLRPDQGIGPADPADGDLPAGHGLALLAGAPHVSWPDDDDPARLDAGQHDPADLDAGQPADEPAEVVVHELDHDGPGDLDFGHGRTLADHDFGAAARHAGDLPDEAFPAPTPTDDVHDPDSLALPDPFAPHHDPGHDPAHDLDLQHVEPGLDDEPDHLSGPEHPPAG